MNRRLLAVAVLVGGTALAARAAVLIRLTDAELVQHSSHVVAGTVTAVSTSWRDPDGDGVSQIWTTVELRVDQVLKGPSRVGDTLTFHQLGGRIGEVEFKIAGMPKFAQGDRELLFLMANLDNPKYTPLVGFAQGRWKIRTDDKGTDFARRDFSDSCFYRFDKNKPIEDAKPSEAEELLSDVVGRFQKEIAAQSGEELR